MSIRSFCFEFDFGDAFVLFGSNHGLLWCVVATPVLEFSSNMARLELQRRKNLYSCPPTSPRAQVFLVCPLTPSAAFLRSNLMEPPSTSAVTCGCLASRAHLSDDRLFLKVHPKGDGRTSNAILDPLPYFFLSAAYLQYPIYAGACARRSDIAKHNSTRDIDIPDMTREMKEGHFPSRVGLLVSDCGLACPPHEVDIWVSCPAPRI